MISHTWCNRCIVMCASHPQLTGIPSIAHNSALKGWNVHKHQYKKNVFNLLVRRLSWGYPFLTWIGSAEIINRHHLAYKLGAELRRWMQDRIMKTKHRRLAVLFRDHACVIIKYPMLRATRNWLTLSTCSLKLREGSTYNELHWSRLLCFAKKKKQCTNNTPVFNLLFRLPDI